MRRRQYTLRRTDRTPLSGCSITEEGLRSFFGVFFVWLSFCPLSIYLPSYLVLLKQYISAVAPLMRGDVVRFCEVRPGIKRWDALTRDH